MPYSMNYLNYYSQIILGSFIFQLGLQRLVDIIDVDNKKLSINIFVVE